MGVSSSPIANLRAKTRHQDSLQVRAAPDQLAVLRTNMIPRLVVSGIFPSFVFLYTRSPLSGFSTARSCVASLNLHKPGLEGLLRASKKQLAIPIAKGDHLPPGYYPCHVPEQ